MGARGPFCLDVRTSLPCGQISVIFGASGVGKSTLLRLIAGLEQPGMGILRFKGKVWLDTQNRFCLPVQQRPLGFVFQDGALFPHLNVSENIAFGNSDPHIFQEVVGLMGLEGLLKRPIRTLSGGQAQRVALARALVRALKTPDALLLLDEPLSALDIPTRTHLQHELKRLNAHFKLTTLLVTHDLHETYALADHIVLMRAHQGVHRCELGTFETLIQSNAQGLLAKVLAKDTQTLTLALNSPCALNPGDLAWLHFRGLS